MRHYTSWKGVSWSSASRESCGSLERRTCPASVGGMKDVSVRGIRSGVLSSCVAIAEIRMSVSIGMEGEHEP